LEIGMGYTHLGKKWYFYKKKLSTSIVMVVLKKECELYLDIYTVIWEEGVNSKCTKNVEIFL
jgi:hypothetical protein